LPETAATLGSGSARASNLKGGHGPEAAGDALKPSLAAWDSSGCPAACKVASPIQQWLTDLSSRFKPASPGPPRLPPSDRGGGFFQRPPKGLRPG
jgi:hypothetical protein